MKRWMNGFTIFIMAVSLFIGLFHASLACAAVTVEVLNPRGEITALPSQVPAPRVTDLAGKKIGIYWIGKSGGNNFFDEIEQLFNAKFPTAKVIRYQGPPFDLGANTAAKLAKECDTFVYGVGD